MGISAEASGLIATSYATNPSYFVIIDVATGANSVVGAIGAGRNHGGDILLFEGTAGDDGMTGGSGDDVINGYNGNDYLIGAGGNDTINGGNGNDKLDGGEGDDTLNGGGGYDGVVYTAATAGITVDLSLRTAQNTGGAGTDTLSNIEDVSGSEFADTITGSRFNNSLSGRGGDDTLIGGEGADRLRGGTGADTMTGGAGKDIYDVDDIGDVVVELADEGTADLVVSSITYTLTENVERLTLTGSSAIDGTGNASANVIVGNSGANTLTGGDGNDTLNGGAGADTMVGGLGNDTYFVDDIGDIVTEAVGEGNDLVKSSLNYTLGDNVDRLVLTGTATLGVGNALNNGITGNDVANELYGLGGRDKLSGGDGNDFLYGGVGNDRLTGGAGGDGFVFDSAPHSKTNVDQIFDFSGPEDTIYLDRAVFSAIGPGELAVGAFHSGTAAVDADDRIIYDSATGNIFYDADGNGAGASVLFAQVTAGTALTNADFFGFG
ncbi:MAG: calcium-binding protein [Sphingomonas sp.]|nr:calcium-binding protein [Sphingomonas sp.]